MAKDNPYIRVGRELKAYFIKEGLSQDDISKKLNVSQQYVSSLLNGRPFGKNTARKWAEAFNLNPSWLITGDGAMFIAQRVTVKELIPDSGSPMVAKLEAMLTDKENVIKQLLSIIDNQAKTIKQLHSIDIP